MIVRVVTGEEQKGKLRNAKLLKCWLGPLLEEPRGDIKLILFSFLNQHDESLTVKNWHDVFINYIEHAKTQVYKWNIRHSTLHFIYIKWHAADLFKTWQIWYCKPNNLEEFIWCLQNISLYNITSFKRYNNSKFTIICTLHSMCKSLNVPCWCF